MAPELRIYGDIGEDWYGEGITAKSVAAWLSENAVGATDITVHMNSFGGSVAEGVAIRNLLEQHPAKVTALVEGFALSSGSVICMGADEIRMLPGSLMMVHPASGWCNGTAKDMETTARALNAMSDNAASIYAMRTGQSKEKCLELMDAETWMTPEEAKALGFCDVVVPGKAPSTTTPPTQRAKQFLNAYQRAPENVRALMRGEAPKPAPSKHGKHAQRFSQQFTTAITPVAEIGRSGDSRPFGV